MAVVLWRLDSADVIAVGGWEVQRLKHVVVDRFLNHP